MMASFSGFLAVVKVLLAHNAQINLQNKVSMKIARVFVPTCLAAYWSIRRSSARVKHIQTRTILWIS